MKARLNYQKISGEGMRALNSVHAYIGKTDLPKTLIDIVYLRVSQINGCAFCIDLHTRDLIKENYSMDKIILVSAWHEAGELYSEQERAALRWAESVTNVSATHVPDEEFEAASAVFGEKELVDLTMAISLMNAFNRLAISFRAVPEAVKALQPSH